MTRNGPQGQESIEIASTTQTLNLQVVADVLVPAIDRNAIKTHLEEGNGPKMPSQEDGDQEGVGDAIHEEKITCPDFGDSDNFDNFDNSKYNPDETWEPDERNKIDPEELNKIEKNFRLQQTPQIDKQTEVEIKLMNLMTQNKLALGTFGMIMKWAKECQSIPGFDFQTAKIRKRDAVFKDIQKHIEIPQPTYHPEIVTWLPDNKPAQIYVRHFTHALYSLLSNTDLMREENLSFPSATNPLQPESDPIITENTYISELHHGSWWTDSWNQICRKDTDPPEILVPLIFYMDGISLDAHGRLSLTPLNMTLGIFSVETRKRPEAWTTIYFHPDSEWESTHHSRKPTAREGVQNIHNAIAVALASLRNLDEKQQGIVWDYLPYGGKVWKVKMRFAIAYVIGDTELHDKLCGKYGSRSGRVKRLCRHCDCPTIDINRPAAQQHARLWTPTDFEIPIEEDATDYLKERSHHHIINAFHSMNFGANPNNIHLATPGETLHMHQLGAARRCVEAIEQQLLNRDVDVKHFAPKLKKGKATLEAIGYMAQRYGALLSRQSDRDFPKTKFATNVVSVAKKEGKDFSGMLLCILVALTSKGGQEILEDVGYARTQIDAIEQIISMEEFLKHGRITPKSLRNLPKTIIHYVNTINRACIRKGMGTKLIKNHLYFHIPEYIKLWGHLLGWDSSFSESHHKTEVKAPAKNTQQNAATLISQTTKRQTEKLVLRAANVCYGLNAAEGESTPKPKPEKAGSQFTIYREEDGRRGGTMKWIRKSNKEKPFLPSVILDFICDCVLPLLDNGTSIEAFTEHNRWDEGNQINYLFRCHPSYRSTSGQVNAVWMDWAVFDVDSKAIPCQILCFVEIDKLKRPTTEVNNYPVATEGIYAVVRKFKKEPVRSESAFISKGSLEAGFFLFNVDTILSDVAVVPELKMDSSLSENNWLVVANRSAWLNWFEERNDNMTSTSYASLHNACTLPTAPMEDMEEG